MFCRVKKKRSFLHFKRYNCAICVVNFIEKNSTHYLNNLKRDPMVESQKNRYMQFMQFTLEVAILKCSFVKHSQEILGVKTIEKEHKTGRSLWSQAALQR
jgi:hypothetical protein